MIDEGYIKFQSDWQPTDALTCPEIDDLIEWRRPLYSAGLIGHYVEINVGYGNISARIDRDSQFVISGTQTGHLPDLSKQHFALVVRLHTGMLFHMPVEVSHYQNSEASFS